MAITDTSSTALAAPAAAAGAAHPAIVPDHRGLAGILGSGDHKTIGRLYIGFALLFGVGALGLWAYFGVDAMGTDHGKFALSAFTLGQIGLVFLFLVPLFVGLGMAIVPLQVGANTVAFPRAAAASLWTWLLASVLLVVSYLPAMDGGINGADKDATSLTLLAFGGVVISLLLAAICIATTVIALRTDGMTLDRVPMFSWSMVVAAGLWLLSLPVLLANLALIFIDAKYGAPVKYGVDFSQWNQLSWAFTQPQVFVYAVPALGIAADAIATLARARQPQRGVVLGAIGCFGALGFGAYAQPVFSSGVFHSWPFVVQSIITILPLLMFLGGVATVIRSGKPKFASPIALALVGVILLALGALAAAPFGIGRLGLQSMTPQLLTNQSLRAATRTSPIYLWGVNGLVLVGAASAAIAGLFYWSAKLTGRKLTDGLGTLLGLALLLAGVLAGLPLVLLGLSNKVDGLGDSANAFFAMAVGGAALAAVVLLIALVLFVAARAAVVNGGATAAPDAWDAGQSLEWACDSPPRPGNFGELAVVTSPQPLLDLAEATDAGGND